MFRETDSTIKQKSIGKQIAGILFVRKRLLRPDAYQ